MNLREGITVGGYAYEGYNPAKVGRVLSITPFSNGGGVYKAMILTLKGDEIELINPNNFENLVEDHRRKYERHKAKLDALRGMP